MESRNALELYTALEEAVEEQFIWGLLTSWEFGLVKDSLRRAVEALAGVQGR